MALPRLPDGAFEWTSPHGHVYRVDHTGTHPIDTPSTAPADPDRSAGPASIRTAARRLRLRGERVAEIELTVRWVRATMRAMY